MWDWMLNSNMQYNYIILLFQIPALANAGFRAIAIDVKGFGDSSAPAGQFILQ